MKRAFVYEDEKSNKFWWIDYIGNDLAVNYGKNGTNGKYEIKEFDSEEECHKQALKIINQKIKKGYKEVFDFNFVNRYYFDNEEIGLHRKTSHPHYINHFKDDFYYDCLEEGTPFGNDEGADTLTYLEEHIRKLGNKDIFSLPRKIIEEYWDMEYFEPNNLELNDIKEQISNGNESNIIICDQVIIATALGQIKITGTVDEGLKNLALLSLERINIVAKINNWNSSKFEDTMIKDISAFNIYV